MLKRHAAVMLTMCCASSIVGAQLPDDAHSAQKLFAPSPQLHVTRNIVYAQYGDRKLKLDLYLPAQNVSRPVPGIIAVRGGGWRQGDKEQFAFIAARLADLGFAAASIEYRTVSEAPFPAAVQDVKAAVRWMRANASVYGINPNALGAIGGSAGGHLVALLGTSASAALEGSGGNPGVSSSIQAMVAMAPPADLTADEVRRNSKGAVATFLGFPPEDSPVWAEASPVAQASGRAIPLLLVHSRTDDTVPYRHSVMLQGRYMQVGAPVELVTIENAPHGFWLDTRWFADVMARAAGFFSKSLSSR